MKKQNHFIGYFIIASAIIWAAVILGIAYSLKETECYSKVQNILVGGVLSHLILIWGPIAFQFKKLKKE